jgi:hypothetical protein
MPPPLLLLLPPFPPASAPRDRVRHCRVRRRRLRSVPEPPTSCRSDRNVRLTRVTTCPRSLTRIVAAALAEPVPARAIRPTRVEDVTPFGTMYAETNRSEDWRLSLHEFTKRRRVRGDPGWNTLTAQTRCALRNLPVMPSCRARPLTIHSARAFYEEQNEVIDSFHEAEELISESRDNVETPGQLTP